MKIRFTKVPKLAVVFYLTGFAILGFTLWVFYSGSKILTTVQFQQLFIAGAVVVTVGSAINILRQFKKTPSPQSRREYRGKNESL